MVAMSLHCVLTSAAWIIAALDLIRNEINICYWLKTNFSHFVLFWDAWPKRMNFKHAVTSWLCPDLVGNGWNTLSCLSTLV